VNFHQRRRCVLELASTSVWIKSDIHYLIKNKYIGSFFNKFKNVLRFGLIAYLYVKIVSWTAHLKITVKYFKRLSVRHWCILIILGTYMGWGCYPSLIPSLCS
jgi:hypothetical protein